MNNERSKVIDESELDEDLKSLLKYRLLLAELSEDNLFTNIMMLKKLKEAYDKNKIKMPKKIKDYIIYQTLKAYEEINLMKKKKW